MMLRILTGDALEKLRELLDESVQCCVTSPPYWSLRDYSCDGQMGLESTPEEYVAKMVKVFREVRRVLRRDGTLWLNLGDTYNSRLDAPHGGWNASGNGPQVVDKRGPTNSWQGTIHGLAPKNLVGVPWRLAFGLQSDGWILRSDIIWAKPNPMPESVTDRPTKAHEYLFLLTKSANYFYDAEAIKEKYTEPMNRWGGQKLVANGSSMWDEGVGQQTYRDRDMRPDPNGRNKRSVWTVATQPYSGSHFAVFPEDLIKPCIMAGTKCGDVVLDPFAGSGTTGMVALELGRKAVLIELNPAYVKLIEQRCDVTPGLPLA